MSEPVTVEELVEYVSTQLLATAAAAKVAGREVIKLKECKLSISYTATKNKNGKLDLKVVGGDLGSTATSMNSIELTFDPVGTIQAVTVDEAGGDIPPIGPVEEVPGSSQAGDGD